MQKALLELLSFNCFPILEFYINNSKKSLSLIFIGEFFKLCSQDARILWALYGIPGKLSAIYFLKSLLKQQIFYHWSFVSWSGIPFFLKPVCTEWKHF